MCLSKQVNLRGPHVTVQKQDPLHSCPKAITNKIEVGKRAKKVDICKHCKGLKAVNSGKIYQTVIRNGIYTCSIWFFLQSEMPCGGGQLSFT